MADPDACAPQPYTRLVLSLMVYEAALHNDCGDPLDLDCDWPSPPGYECGPRWLPRRIYDDA
jgi:hypothetical protein